MTEQAATTGAREWGHRFWDGTAGPDETREATLEQAARFKPGCVEIVHRDSPDAEWQRADYQPHMPSERLDQLAAHIVLLGELNDWRGQRLAELGQYPNPPREYIPPRRADRHFPPGCESGIPGGTGASTAARWTDPDGGETYDLTVPLRDADGDQWALASGQDAGVWGGMSEDERRALKRRESRQRQREAR